MSAHARARAAEAEAVAAAEAAARAAARAAAARDEASREMARAMMQALLKVVIVADGALAGFGVACVACCILWKSSAKSSVLGRILKAPSVEISGLRSVLSGGDGSGQTGGELSSGDDAGMLMVARGTVDLKCAAEKGDRSCDRGPDLLVSQGSGEKGVIVQRIVTCVHNEPNGVLYGRPTDTRSQIQKCLLGGESSSMRMVPFVLVDGEIGKLSDYLVVNMEGSKHPLPLKTVYSALRPMNDDSRYAFVRSVFSPEKPLGLLYEEKILPLEKELTAVGICSLKNGILEIKSCKDLPYFLCDDLDKDKIVAELSFEKGVLKWSGLALGGLALAIIGYSISRMWMRWRRRREAEHRRRLVLWQEALDEEPEEGVPEGEVCVICLTRRRCAVFLPCGHLVCCQGCALGVELERGASPRCPVCRQRVRSSTRVYNS